MLIDRSIKPEQKVIWIDTETGGFNPNTDALLQIAFIISDKEGNELCEYNSHIAPIDGDRYSKEALSVSGITEEQLKSFLSPLKVYSDIMSIFSRFGYKGVKSLRFIPAGYNVSFDLDFIDCWMTKIDSKFAFWNYLQHSGIDVLPILRAFRFAKIFDIPDTKLETVCKHFGIPLEAHNAISDIRATKVITEKIISKIFTIWTGKQYNFLNLQKQPLPDTNLK